MKRKPESRRRASERTRFAPGRFLLRGLGHRLLLAASVVAAVALFAGIRVTLADPGFSEAEDGVWWAFLRLTDPGYLVDDEGLARRSVSTVVTVLGSVIALGLLIAILVMGWFFPLGMVRFGDEHKAWLRALDGAFGVLASVVSPALAMTLDFSTVAWIGVLAYA